MLHIPEMSISSRGKFAEYVCADPGTQRELFPRQQKCLCVRLVQGAFSVSSSLDLWVLLGAGLILFVGRRAGYPRWAGLGSQPPIVSLSLRWDGRMAAGQSEGRVESSPERLLPSCLTADKRIWKQMAPSATQITRGRFSGERNSTYFLCQQMDRLSTYDPGTRHSFNYLYLKFQLGMVIWV